MTKPLRCSSAAASELSIGILSVDQTSTREMPARPAAPVPARRSSVATTALPCESCPVTMRRTSSAMAFLLYEFIGLGRVAFDRDDRDHIRPSYHLVIAGSAPKPATSWITSLKPNPQMVQ